MTKINLLNRKGITFGEFKAWLEQLVADKKGALPDLTDWKNIKEMMDKVKVGVYDGTFDYPVLQTSVVEYWFTSPQHVTTTWEEWCQYRDEQINKMIGMRL